MILIHPSSLGKLMADAKSKKPEDLSAGAMTYCRELAKQAVYGYTPSISSKYLDKGRIVEQQSIELYNEVFFTDLVKNTERKTNQWLNGECDIFTGSKIIDIKSSWSIASFPAIRADAEDSDYKWQGRAYMMLWDCDQFEIAYCLVNTPAELIGFEDESLHYVDHIAPELRVTTVSYERDKEKEELIKIKVESARKYIDQIIQQIAHDHAA